MQCSCWCTYRVGELLLLLEELDDAVGELRVVHAEALGLVQRQQHLEQERLVLLLERRREPVDDAPEDLQQLRRPAVPLRLVDEPARAALLDV